MYGTRSKWTWRAPENLDDLGFDVYISNDLVEWSEPVEVFRRPKDFWSNEKFWAPEVHYYQEKFYMFATFGSTVGHKGTQILIADSPLGPFREHSNGKITPDSWECLDGTLYIEDGTPYMVFCHEWQQIGVGEICSIALSPDLKEGRGEIKTLLKADQPAWADKQDGKYVTDGPFFYKKTGGLLYMIWSSLEGDNYVEAVSRSTNGLLGEWTHDDQLLFNKDGGHGMIFTDKENRLLFTLHEPNTSYHEHPSFYEVNIDNHSIKIVKNLKDDGSRY